MAGSVQTRSCSHGGINAAGGTVGIIANPVSGRDVRRVAARGAVSTTEDKRNRIARAVIGAVTAGATRIVAMAEPFSIATGALTDLRIDAEVEIVDVGATVSPADTIRAAEAMRSRNVSVLVTLGGDGTNRTIAKVWPEATLVPMSTGTNNVFPSLTEPTVAGAAAGLVASGAVSPAACAPRSKLVTAVLPGCWSEIALVDAVTLADDFVGNRMPADGMRMRQLLVSQAHPASIGLSSLAGLLRPCSRAEDAGVLVECGPGGRPMRAPLAPGLYGTVPVLSCRTLELGEAAQLRGPAVLSLDGDRERAIGAHESVTARVQRNGPRVVDVQRTLELGAAAGVFEMPLRGAAASLSVSQELSAAPPMGYRRADGTEVRDCC
ncbi:NAD(+)/NADH kinase [Candidatus Poriferisodalis sp.]|uniref:NAD(+)/NADH kinase n=1 Tax=Candidatus Poriferisodalis sp. TaxID=3101277 RepID=UPI003B024AF6